MTTFASTLRTTLRTTLAGALLAASLSAALMPAPALADNRDRRVTIINDSGFDLQQILFRLSGTHTWEEAILEDPLEPGDSVDYDFDNARNACFFDLLPSSDEDKNDELPTLTNINVCEVERVYIRRDPS